MLTEKQKEVLLFIDKFTRKNGYSPSYDEILEPMGLESKSGIHRIVSALEERGFIRRLANKARAIEVLKLPPDLETTAKTKQAAIENYKKGYLDAWVAAVSFVASNHPETVEQMAGLPALPIGFEEHLNITDNKHD